MGSSSSKSRVVVTSSESRRSVSRNVFESNCIIINRSSSASFNGDSDTDDDDVTRDDGDDEQITDHRVKETVIEQNRSNIKSKPNKTKRSDKRACKKHSETQISEWGESSLSGSVSRSGSGSSRNRSSRFLSRFNFFPGNTSSRSSRSSKAYPESSTSSVVSNDDIQSTRSANRTKTRQGCDIFPSCLLPTSPERKDDDSDSDNSDASSIRELGRYDTNNGIEPYRTRRMEAREPVEQNVRFSRTLSVGRLRDRVLQRPTFPELASFPFQQEHETESRSSNENVTTTPASSSSYSVSAMTNSLYGNHEFEVESLGSRDSSSYANLLEHRSNFLERRRRIRSQVHALQRMGSRFENLSGHERSCILSGQHRTGHCTCRLSNQDSVDSANARGSISRIVLLAEALFEVLDEIHQQSVVSSSRPALSSLGSVPAPVEVVEALPVKLYCNLPKKSYEDDAQCYICLVEYEDGDEVRVLPCHHEFHKSCVDKWLKEIHRICPLCRGDVCKTSSASTESS